MKIGMLSHWYDPEGGAAAGPGTIARALHQRGHQVDVVTGYPIYPTGRLAEGYRLRPYQREVLRGVTVHRSPIYPSHDMRAAHRMANYMSYAASGSAIAAAVLKDCDVLYVYSTPATAAVPALLLRAVTGKNIVTHIQDLWPQTVTASGFVEGGSRNSRMERVLHRYCDAVYRRSHAIAVTSPGMAELIKERGVPRERIHFVPNWAEESSFHPAERDRELGREIGLDDTFTVMYAGNFGEMQQLDTVLDAAALLLNHRGIQIALVGGGVMTDHLHARVERDGLSNVHLVAPQPFDRMSDILALGDVQLISLKDVPLYRNTLPSKLQATLAAARPIIGALAGDAAEVVAGSGSGLVTKPGDAAALANAVLTLHSKDSGQLAAMGLAGRRYYESAYSEQSVGDRLEALLRAAGEDQS